MQRESMEFDVVIIDTAGRLHVDQELMEEVKKISDLGVKRIEFIDDIFNVKAKDFVAFFNKVIQSNLKVSFFFPFLFPVSYFLGIFLL